MKSLSILAAWAVLVAGLCLLQDRALGDDLQDFADYQKAKLTSLEAGHEKILASAGNDPAVAGYRKRLALVDEVGRELINEFARCKAASLDILVEGDALPAKASGTAGPGDKTSQPSQPMEAAEILGRYGEAFGVGLSAPNVGKDQLGALRSYYDAKAGVVAQYIAEKGKPIAAINPKFLPQVLELCLVIPFLHIADADWSAGQIAALPEWMRSADNLPCLEKFSLRCRRPLTAYRFAAAGAELRKAKPEDMLAYLKRAAQEAEQAREYHAAIGCYRAAIDKAMTAGQAEDCMSLRLSLCELLARLDHPQLAAEEAKTAMSQHGTSKDYGKAVVLRLKFLYESGQYKQIEKESAEYRLDERVVKQLPQVLYIGWVSARRDNQLQRAGELQEEFVKLFPEHPLCADVYFATAMSKLAEGHYEEAAKLLEIVEVRFPRSALAPKVKEIRAKLQKTWGPGSRGNQAGSKDS